MWYRLLIILLFTGLMGCGNSDDPKPEPDLYTGTATAMVNGDEWNARVYFREGTNTDNFTLGIAMHVHNEIGYKRESLAFSNVRPVFSSQLVKSQLDNPTDDIESLYTTFVADGDAVAENYVPDSEINDHQFQFTSVNSETGEISGTFQVTLLLRVSTGDDRNPPESLTFVSGSFTAIGKASWFD